MKGRLLRGGWTWQQVIEQSKLEAPASETAQVVNWLAELLLLPP